MPKLYVCNAFSLNMLDRSAQAGTPNGYTPRASDPIAEQPARVPRPVQDPIAFLYEFLVKFPGHWELVSAVGHESTAIIFAQALEGWDIPCNRTTVKLHDGDIALIGQYIGPRLPEGATQLPEGATIEWWSV